MSEKATYKVTYWGGDEPTVVETTHGHTKEEAENIVNTFVPTDERRAVSATEEDQENYEFCKLKKGVFLSCGVMYETPPGSRGEFGLPPK